MVMHNADKKEPRYDMDTSRSRRQAALVGALGRILPPECVLYRHEDTVPYECDALTAYRCPPLAVALPETAEQVAAILRSCHEMRVPVLSEAMRYRVVRWCTAASLRIDVVAG